MNSSAFLETHPRHPLAGLEAWPKTGPIYGLVDEEPAPLARGFWTRIGERLRRGVESEPASTNSRIWY